MEMTRRQLLLLSLSALPLAAKGVLDWQRETLIIADQLDHLNGSGRLFAIKPSPLDSQAQIGAHPERFFHAHPIRGQAALENRDTDVLLRALSRSLRRGASFSKVSDCFEPHHAMRIVRKGVIQADVLICFECDQVYYFSKGRPLHGYLSGGREVFEDVARAYGLPPAPAPSNAPYAN